MKRLIATAMATLLACAAAWAGDVKGKVRDAAGAPLPFVNAILYQGQTLVKGTVTDDEGTFVISGVKEGSYSLSVTYMGYETAKRELTMAAGRNASVNLGIITLQEETQQVEEVAVVAQKSTMKLDIDKKVFDVSQDIASTGGSASDVLENIPSVEVDSEGNISLRGSQSVTVWINGKAQGLTSDNRGDILQQLPSESIEKVEVITNPSSKYSPEGSAGIINIVLKRDRRAGYYGGAQLSINDIGGGRIGGNINFSSSLIDAYLNLGYGRRRHKNGGWTDRDYMNGDVATGFLNSVSEGEMTGNHLFLRTGLTWHITQNDELSVGYMGMRGGGDRDNDITYESDNYGTFAAIDPFWRLRATTSDNDMRMNNFDVSFRHQWATGHFIEAMASKNSWKMDGETTYDQRTIAKADVPDGVNWRSMLSDGAAVNSYQRQTSDIRNGNTDVRVDYEMPIGNASKLQAGYQGTFGRENSPTETFSDEAMTQSVRSLFNRFKYDSDIHALYANWNSRINERFGYQLGLRGEWWKINTTSYGYAEEYEGAEPSHFEKSYSDIFPTAFLSYAISETQELQLNYTRRLRRPWGGQMNSFKNISDSTSISYGNPLLTPEFTNSLELNYLKNWDNHTVSVSTYYRPSTDVIQQISYLENGVRFSTSENIAKNLSAGVEIVGKNRLWKRLDLTTTVNLYYHKLDGGTFSKVTDNGNEVSIVVRDDESFSWNIREMASVMLPWEITYQAMFNYDAPRVITQGKTKASYSLNMGLRKSFAKRKFNLALNCRDLLESRANRSTTSAQGFRQESYGWRGGRRFILQFSWNFGNMAAKKPQMQQQMDGGEGMSASGYEM